MAQTIWVIVANSWHAKCFKVSKFPKIELIETLEHPESRLHNGDLVTSKPGRNFNSVGGGRHAYSETTEPKEVEIEKFSKSISQHLKNAFQKGEFNQLYLFANQSFLGHLRKDLDHHFQNSIVEIPKDLTTHTTEEIEDQLKKARNG